MAITGSLPKVLVALRQFLTSEFADDGNYFCIVYGSFADGSATQASDLDLLIASKTATYERRVRAVEFVVRLHEAYGLILDFEIPYDTKVLVDFAYLEAACAGSGFRADDGQWTIPAIVKTPEFLASDALLARFILGMMNHKHVFVSGERAYYHRLRAKSGEVLLRAICAARGVETLTVAEAINLYVNFGDVSGDYYLGFDTSRRTRLYLRGYLSRLMSRLAAQGKITRDGPTFSVRSLVVTTDA